MVAPWLEGIKVCVRCISSLLLDALLKVSICTRCRRARLTVGFRDACMLSSLGELAQGVLPCLGGARPFLRSFLGVRLLGLAGAALLHAWAFGLDAHEQCLFFIKTSLLSGILTQTVCALVLLQLWPPRLACGVSWYSFCSPCARGSAGSVVVPFVVLFAAFLLLWLA